VSLPDLRPGTGRESRQHPAYLLALERAAAGSFYYLENGEASLKSIVESIARLLGGNSRVNADKARRELHWKPRGAGLFEEIERGWYRRQLEAGAYVPRAGKS
jgi:hypothetical protein